MMHGPTPCKTLLAETTHPQHADEKHQASSDLIETQHNHRQLK